MIEISGKLSADDYVRAQYLHIRPRLAFKVVGALLIAAFVWTVWISFTGGSSDLPSWPGFVVVAASIYLLAFFFIYIPWRSRRTYGQQKSLRRESRMKVSESGIQVENEVGQATVPWTDYAKWKENDRLFLLYLSDPVFHLVPKRFFSNVEDVSDFRQLLLTQIGASAA